MAAVGVALWMIALFALSSRPVLTPLPPIGHIDKLVHALAYAVGAWLWIRALGPSRGAAWAAFALASLYGMSDEWHQSFVPGRDATWGDVAADAVGSACAALLTYRRAARRVV